MKSFRVVVLFSMLLTALGVFAQQQGSVQTPQTAGTASQNPSAQTPQVPTPQPQSPQAQSSQSPAAPPPYTGSQTQPGIAQSPGQTPAQSPETQTPQREPSQAPPMHSGGSGADAQVNALTQALNLNSDQQARIKTILEDQHQQGESVVNDASLSHDAKLQKVHALRQSTIEKVRATLSTDEQKSKFDSMIQVSNERIRQREQQEQQQPK